MRPALEKMALARNSVLMKALGKQEAIFNGYTTVIHGMP